MARPVNPNSQYTVKPHQVGGHLYASTQPWSVNPATGRKEYHYLHWGTVVDMVFHPNARFLSLSREEMGRLIFPPGWNLDNIGGGSVPGRRGRPSYTGDAANRLYGHVWLLEQIAERTGLRDDLTTVFDGNRRQVDIVLTLAMFPYLTKFTYNRLERWQRTDRAPCDIPLTPSFITTFTQSITEKHRLCLLRLRARRMGRDELCAVDSTSRTAWGGALADIRWGKNKERLPLPQTTEVVVYTLSGHMPVYYRTFPGNMNDARSLRVILVDMEHAGFMDLVYITDRGYESRRNIEQMILKGRKAVMCVRTSLKMVSDAIGALGDFTVRPDGMEIDPESRLYMAQSTVEYKVRGNGECAKAADMRLNLYFDPVRRSTELVELDIAVKEQKEELDRMVGEKEQVPDVREAREEFRFFNLDIDETSRLVRGYELDRGRIASAKRLSGFFSLLTIGLDWDARTALGHYSLRDEQEKYFEQMKDQMVADRQRNWSEEGKAGRLFVLFVSLILSSYVRHVWKTTSLKKMFSSSLEILDEMRPVRCIEHPKKARVITPFIGRQLDICEAFGFVPPKGCGKDYVTRKVTEGKKRGRPRKAAVVSDL
jgi:hypothetical protein